MTTCLYSFTGYAIVTPDGTDHYYTFPIKPNGTPGAGGLIGAGVWPTGAFYIQGVEILAQTTDPTAYAVLGATPPNGDYISRRSLGPGSFERMFPEGKAFLFPNDGAAELHLHAMCAPGKTLIPFVTVFHYPAA